MVRWWWALPALVSNAFRVNENDSKRMRLNCVQPWLPESSSCAARSIEEMPTLLAETQYTVQYASSPIASNGLGPLSHVLSLTHSALVITEINAEGVTPPTSLLFEYFAQNFGPKAVLPSSLQNGTLTWENQAVVGWRRPDDAKDWVHTANLTTVGTATGKTLTEWFAEVVKYGEEHPGYNLFNLWTNPDVTRHLSYVDDSVCHSFTEWSLGTLWKLGADLTVEGPLCRNYFSFITATRPRLLDLASAVDREAIMDFYGSIHALASKNFRDISDLGSTLLDLVRGAPHHEVVLFQLGQGNSSGKYFHSLIEEPYLGVMPYQLSQRMILPWQRIPADVTGECEYLSGKRFSALPA